MRTLLCDADIPEPLVNALIALRIPAMSINRIPGAVENDQKVVEVAHNLDAIIVTLDRDFTSNKPLFAALVERGAKVVILRPPKCERDQVIERLAQMFLDSYREWESLLDNTSGLVSCTSRGNRLRELKDFPWYSEIDDRGQLK